MSDEQTSRPHSTPDNWELVYARLTMHPNAPSGTAWHAAYQHDVKWLLEQLEAYRQEDENLRAAVPIYERLRSTQEQKETADLALVIANGQIADLREQLEAYRSALVEIERTDWFDGEDRLVWPDDIAREVLNSNPSSEPPAPTGAVLPSGATKRADLAQRGSEISTPAKEPLRKPGRSSECGHSWWVPGCPVCEREKRDALAEQSPAKEPTPLQAAYGGKVRTVDTDPASVPRSFTHPRQEPPCRDCFPASEPEAT